MAIKKKFIHFKKKESFQRELDAGNILNTSIVFIADAKQIYLNGTYFSENTLFNLSELLDNISGELKETDTVNEAVIKLYKMLSNDTDIIKVLVQEINDLETNITERLDTTDEVVAAALTNLNQTLEGLKYQEEINKINELLAPIDFNIIDLGLPSGTLWCDRNIGAESPEDIGLYFAWGEITGYSKEEIEQGIRTFSANTYKYGQSMTKYNDTDKKVELDNEDNAAYTLFGKDWDLPTPTQVNELIANTTCTQTLNGLLLTSKINSNTLFLPYSGKNGSLQSGVQHRLWLKERSSMSYRSAYFMQVFTSSLGMRDENSRYEGLNIRPVTSATNPSSTFKNIYTKTETEQCIDNKLINYAKLDEYGKVNLNVIPYSSGSEYIANVKYDANVNDSSISNSTSITSRLSTEYSGQYFFLAPKLSVYAYNGNREANANSSNLVQERGLVKALEPYVKLTDGLIPAQYLPSYVDDVLEFPLLEAFPTPGETGKIYVDTTENRTYRWSGTQYTEIGKSLSLGETSSTAYAGDKGAANAAKVINLEENLNKAISDIAIYPFDGFTDSFDNETSKPNGTILWGPSGFKIKVNGEWITDLPNYIAPGMLGGGGGPRVDRLFRYNNVLYRFQNLSDGDTLVPAVPLATDETHGIIKVNGVTDNINKSIYTNSNGEIGLGVGSGVVTGNTRVSLTEDIGFGEVGFDNNSTELTPTVKLYVYDGSRELGENNLNLVEEKGLHATLQNYPKLGSDNRLSVNIIPINNVFDGTAYPSKTGTSSPVITKITNTDRVLGTLTNVYVYDGSRDLISDSINLVEEKGLYSVINPIQENLDDIEADINGLDTSLVNLANVVANKVTVVEGKDLSSNDYTDADKTKLTGLREYTLATNSDIDAIING